MRVFMCVYVCLCVCVCVAHRERGREREREFVSVCARVGWCVQYSNGEVLSLWLKWDLCMAHLPTIDVPAVDTFTVLECECVCGCVKRLLAPF